MFGCLIKFIKGVVIILAVIGFVTIGGVTFFKEIFNNPFSKLQTSKIQKASEIADFSNLDEEFELVSSSKLPKIGNYVYIKHDASSQKFYFSKPSKQDILTKTDFNTKEADVKINSFVKDFKLLQLENFEITGRGSTSALGQTIPYVKFKSDIVNFPINGIKGIIGVFTYGKDNIIIVSANSNGKYSQIITNVLLEELK